MTGFKPVAPNDRLYLEGRERQPEPEWPIRLSV